MADRFARWWVHTVQVSPFLGDGAYGPQYGPQTPLLCFVDDKRSLVRDSDGAEVVSSSRIMAPAGTTTLTPGTRVTLPSGREGTIISVAVHDSGTLNLPDHVEAAVD